MRNFYIPMRGANWRDATRRTNLDYLASHVNRTLKHVAFKDITKFQLTILAMMGALRRLGKIFPWMINDKVWRFQGGGTRRRSSPNSFSFSQRTGALRAPRFASGAKRLPHLESS